MELKDKVIAITGGASGLGETSTRHFVSQGEKSWLLILMMTMQKSFAMS